MKTAGGEAYLRRALELAEAGRGSVSPNPMVGAVLVRGGRVVGTGYHRRPGSAHAEVAALRAAGTAARGATLYVNLEPCAHTGRTPPCVDAIVAGGVRHVIASMKDPNPLVRGRGFAALRRAGVRVTCGGLGREARALNEAYLTFIERGRPFVVLKAGMSLDGRIATASGASRWITSAAARREAHGLRAGFDAILVGVGTVLADDPELAARRRGRERAGFLRVVLDSRLRTPLGSRLVRHARRRPTLIYAGAGAPGRRQTALEAAGVEVRRLGRGARVAPRAVLRDLGRREILSLLVEGGGEVHGGFLEAGLADKVLFFVAPLLLGGRDAVPVIGGRGAGTPARGTRLRDLQVGLAGPDLKITAYTERGGG